MQPFVALDFETANGKRASACSVGLAKFDDKGQLAGTFHSLIKPHPEHRFFHPANIWVHGIRPDDVADAPEWGDIYFEVAEFIGDLPLSAHNFGFDGSVLNQLTELYQHAPVANPRYCTLRLARRLYPELPKKSLDVVFEHLFGNEMIDHHNAEADAVAAGRVFAKMQESFSIEELESVLLPSKPKSRLSSPKVADTFTVEELVQQFGTSTVLQGESVCFTDTLERGRRADLEELLAVVGTSPSKGATAKTSILVVGVPNPAAWKEGAAASRKLEKATALREKGKPIRVLSEEDFFALLEE